MSWTDCFWSLPLMRLTVVRISVDSMTVKVVLKQMAMCRSGQAPADVKSMRARESITYNFAAYVTIFHAGS